MHIRRYGIRLMRLREEHIEMVRQRRNAQEIRSFMEFQEHITPEMQKKWFHSLDRLRDFYFVIEHHYEPVGLIHTSGIDWNKKTGNAGLFIWKHDLLGSHVPVLASLTMVDFFFRFCTLRKLYAKVRKNNAVAIKYNARLGFEPVEKLNRKAFGQYALDKNDYFKATVRLHEMAQSLGGNLYEVVIENDLLNALKARGGVAAKPCGAMVTVVN